MINKLFKSSYFKNAAILTSATTIGQLITLLTAPVLTRLYSPSTYDLLGVYMMVTSLIGTFSTLQYQHVIIVAKDELESIRAVHLCFLLSIFATLISVLILLVIYFVDPFLFGSNSVWSWLFWSPLSIFITGITVALSNWANKMANYRTLSLSRIVSSILVPVVSITLGYFFGGSVGLFLGLLISQLVPFIYLVWKFYGPVFKNNRFDLAEVKSLFFRYSDFVKFTLPSEFLNNFTNQLPVFFLTKSFGLVGLIGNFNLSTRLMGMPIQLISTSVSEVFRENASKQFNETGSCREVFMKTFKTLFILDAIPFTLLFFLAPYIFEVVFGSNWVIAGRITQILIPMYFLRFVVSPLTYVFFIANKQRQDLVGQVSLFLLVFLAFFITSKNTDNYLILFTSYSITYCIKYLVYFYFSWKYSIR